MAALIVGGSVPVTGLLNDYPLLTGQAIRYAIGALALYGWLRLRDRRRRSPSGGATASASTLPRLTGRDVFALLGMVGAGMVGFNAAVLYGQRYATPGLVAAVLGASPLVLAIAVPALRRRWPSPAALVGAVLVIGGVAVLTGGGSWHGPGLALALLTLACEVMFTLCAAGMVARHGAVETSTWSCIVAAVGESALGTVFGGWRMPTGTEAAALLVLGFVVTALAFGCWYTGVSVLGADRAGVLIGLMPVSGLAVSVLLGAQQLTMVAALGAATVTAGCVVGLRSIGRANEHGPARVRACSDT
ncbi:DMT family transporter [Solihabitans fulvus]|uniref:DMT family transporter n=2 Tax=Solihabitans fulvus TaxID=1892852 RepID=A0A5B2XJ35_9PSEU|nr:DMT family transporter [Solihabitans fulvus]